MAKKKKNRRQSTRPPGSSTMSGMGGGGTGAGGMGGLMSQMSKLQEEMEKTQGELADEVLTISSGGGMVTIEVTGQQEIRDIKIDPEAVDPEDVEMLQDLILAAVTEALEKSKELQEERMGGLTSGLGLPPGLGL